MTHLKQATISLWPKLRGDRGFPVVQLVSGLSLLRILQASALNTMAFQKDLSLKQAS